MSYSGIQSSVPPQQGTAFYGSSYDANNAQSTASTYHNGLSKSTTGTVPPQQYSEYYKSKPADQYNSNASSDGRGSGARDSVSHKSKGMSTTKYPPFNG